MYMLLPQPLDTMMELQVYLQVHSPDDLQAKLDASYELRAQLECNQ
jgi:hypothetical protein